MPSLSTAAKWQRKADRANAQAAAAEPLYADQLPRVSARELWEKNRRQVAAGAERTSTHLVGLRLLRALDESLLRQVARQHLPADVFTRLLDYRRRVYPASPDYGLPFWEGILTGTKRVVFAWRLVESPKRRLEEDGVWPPAGWKSPLAAEQIRARFPVDRWRTNTAYEQDDGGLSRLVDAAIARSRAK